MSYIKISSPIYEFFNPKKEVRIQGDKLGIFIYLFIWVYIILIFVIFQETTITRMNTFYLAFDIIAISFIIIYFYNEKTKENFELFDFPDQKNLLYMFIFTLLIYGIILVINAMITEFIPLQIRGDLSYSIFSLVRVVPVEELVFRGMAMFIFIILLSKIFNRKENKKREIIIWYLTIVIVGILFGFYHYPKFYDEKLYPYFSREINGVTVFIHIIFPLLYLSLLGIGLGLCRYKYGLTSAMLLHFINNLCSSAILYYF